MKILILFLYLLISLGTANAGWEYSERKDLMTDEVTDTFANLRNPTPPYGDIIVANRKVGGIDASLAFNAASVDCPERCSILVRVDSSAPRTFAVKNSVNQLYMDRPLDFMNFIKEAKRIRVQFKFERVEGNQFRGEVVSTFYVEEPLTVRPLTKGVGQR